MTSHNSFFYGRRQEGFNMVRADTNVDTIQLWKWLWIDDVVQKNTLARNTHQDDFESHSNNGGKNVPIYIGFPAKMPLSAVPQEGPETVLCGTVMAARWQQDNIGVRFRSMTSHKNRFWQEARFRTTLKGPRSPWKSGVMNSCHW